MQSKPPLGPFNPEAELEALARFAAARVLLDAVLAGHWRPTPEVTAHVRLLVAQGERFLEVGRWAA